MARITDGQRGQYSPEDLPTGSVEAVLWFMDEYVHALGASPAQRAATEALASIAISLDAIRRHLESS